jgi:trans-aconitate methyltransferase
MERKQHWEHLFESKAPTEVSWFQREPTLSLRLLDAAGLHAHSWVIDIGGGDSCLVDHLLARGVRCVTVVDISGAALRRAAERLPGAPVTWIEGDVTGPWTAPPVDLWHDRAVFHFLTEAQDRSRYIEHLRDILKPQGQAIFATFAPDGPSKCSGLPVRRYSADGLSAELGPRFRLLETLDDDHQTPSGGVQRFCYSRFIRE